MTLKEELIKSLKSDCDDIRTEMKDMFDFIEKGNLREAVNCMNAIEQTARNMPAWIDEYKEEKEANNGR